VANPIDAAKKADNRITAAAKIHPFCTLLVFALLEPLLFASPIQHTAWATYTKAFKTKNLNLKFLV
jgi:hypothetical protein